MCGTPNYDKLGKVLWLIVHLSEAFMKYNNSQPEQSIDECIVFIVDLIIIKCPKVYYVFTYIFLHFFQIFIRGLIPYHGCCEYQQYLPDKPVKR